MQALLAHPWQGNVRELDHAVERAVLMAQGDMVKARRPGAARRREGTPRLEDMSLEDVEAFSSRRRWRDTKETSAMPRTRSGLSRSALYRRLQRFGM